MTDPAMSKPDAPSCERNREPILAVLRDHFTDRRKVLEIGSGTGQHAIHFAAAMPHLTWQTSDRMENLPGIRAWLDEQTCPIRRPHSNSTSWGHGRRSAMTRFSAPTPCTS
jgi:hypothetical protein